MSKRIILCADGTWQTAANRSNVYRFYRALTLGADQMPFYDEGVGANGDPLTTLLGGAFGLGLWDKVKRGYSKLAQVYEKGDDVYLFGFSRGAYTARSLAGMIVAVGLPTQNFTDDLVDTAFTAYREKDDRKKWLAKLKDCNLYVPDIKMLGVWDTVGALGIPAVVGLCDPVVYGFLDTSLSPRVKYACHALAIDEKRAQFQPTLWTNQPVADQVVEQTWFSGCHADVGGGNIDPEIDTASLTDITLGWMLARAKVVGLTFDQTVLDNYKLPIPADCALTAIHESWKLVNGVPIRRSIDKNANLANSVRVRCAHDSSYRPKPLKFTKTGLSKQYPLAVIVTEDY
jgi:uncharacterized protein (DUF2235 family)